MLAIEVEDNRQAFHMSIVTWRPKHPVPDGKIPPTPPPAEPTCMDGVAATVRARIAAKAAALEAIRGITITFNQKRAVTDPLAWKSADQRATGPAASSVCSTLRLGRSCIEI